VTTKKDLAEAYLSSRRRLVTVLVSGAPGDREPEPTRPGRACVAGLVLALVVAAGGALSGHLGEGGRDPSPPGSAKPQGEPPEMT
jgi:hypothetical protein